MGRFKGKIIDRNRLVKRYPFARSPKRPTFLGDNSIVIELGKLSFVGEQEKEFFFEEEFPDINYNIMLVPRDTGTGESANVNLYVDNTRSTARKITVVASSVFTGDVDIMAVRID